MASTPEETGRQMAEALVASLEQLKQQLAGPAAGPAQAQRAGDLAVEAMKALLPEVTAELGQRPHPACGHLLPQGEGIEFGATTGFHSPLPVGEGPGGG